jgi:hypothetical protein
MRKLTTISAAVLACLVMGGCVTPEMEARQRATDMHTCRDMGYGTRLCGIPRLHEHGRRAARRRHKASTGSPE